MNGGKWIRIEAEAYADERREAKQNMLDEYGEALTRMYSVDDGKYAVVYLKNAKARICSFTEAPVEINF